MLQLLFNVFLYGTIYVNKRFNNDNDRGGSILS